MSTSWLDVWMTDGMAVAQNRQKTMGEPRRESFVIPPSPDVLSWRGCPTEKDPRPRRPRRLAVQGPPGRIFLVVVVGPTIVSGQSAAAGSGATPR